MVAFPPFPLPTFYIGIGKKFERKIVVVLDNSLQDWDCDHLASIQKYVLQGAQFTVWKDAIAPRAFVLKM